jgi:hypothetical protein
VDRYLSSYRIHDQHKTGVGGDKRHLELAAIYGKHAGAKYERLIQGCAKRRSIAFSLKWLSLLRLNRFAPSVLKVAFPLLFRGFRQNEIRDMMTMM